MVAKHLKLVGRRHIEHLPSALGGSGTIHIGARLPVRMRKRNVGVLQGISSDEQLVGTRGYQ